MPRAPRARCTVPMCPEWATARGKCATHYVPWEQPSANTRALTGRQRAELRRKSLTREPNCRECNEPAAEADHIIPIWAGGARFSMDNIQSLCGPCHEDKTNRESAARNRGTRPKR